MSASDPGLRRLAAATLLVPFPGLAAPGWVLRELEAGLGGVCLFARNVGDERLTGQLTGLTASLHGAADTPLVAIDEEGGDVTRVAHLTGSPYPGNAALGAIDDTSLTRRVHQALGADLAAAGINVNLAPSVDVNTADDNPVIGTRAFGSDPDLVARHAVAAVVGLQDNGVAACAKHFPGHGATRVDSHHELPLIDAGPELLDRRELAPFRAAIAAGVRAVMTAHIQVPWLTGNDPVTLSSAALTGLLRARLGFRGPIVTDALEMRGVSAERGVPRTAVRALAAGADLLCLGALQYADVVTATLEAIVDAVAAGELPAARLEQAAGQVAGLRAWIRDAGEQGQSDMVGLAAARRAVRLEGRIPPLEGAMIVEVDAPPGMAVGDVPWGLAEHLAGTDMEAVRLDPLAHSPAEALAKARHRPLVVVVRDAHRHEDVRVFVEALVATRPDAVVVEMGLPVWRPACTAYLASYGAARVNGQAAAELLRGARTPADAA